MSNKIIKNNKSQKQIKKEQQKKKNELVLGLTCLAVLVVAMIIVIVYQNSKKANTRSTSGSKKVAYDYSNKDYKEDTDVSGKYYAEIKIKNYGDIVVTLDADTAPITVANFISLVNKKFYDGLTFHRIISGFMIQGGDPLGNGTGGSDENIKGEFASNGVENNLKHKRGVLSMARSMDPNSASSQFFIMHEDATHLDGQYAAFGYVYGFNGENDEAFNKYMAVVDKICDTVPVTDSNGTVRAKDQPVIESIRMIEMK